MAGTIVRLGSPQKQELVVDWRRKIDILSNENNPV